MEYLYQTINRKQKGIKPMTTLFIVAAVVFLYMCYVLLKPEEF